MSWTTRDARSLSGWSRSGLCLLMLFFSAGRTDGGLVIRPTFDATITTNANAAQIENTINQVIALYNSTFTDNITVNITFKNMTSGLGQSSKPIYYVPTSTYLSALRSDSTTTNDAAALSRLPVTSTDPVRGLSYMFVGQANLKALGFAVGSGSDGTIGVNTSITNITRTSVNSSKYDLFAVVSHEIDEILGLGSGLNLPRSYGGYVMPEDLFRYGTASGQRSYTTSSTAVSYFSIDGVNRLVQFSQYPGADYGDWYSNGPHTPRVQDAFGTPGVIINPGVAEFTALDVIGFNLAGTSTARVSGNAPNSISASGLSIASPEPSSIALAFIGSLSAGSWTRRRRTRRSAPRS